MPDNTEILELVGAVSALTKKAEATAAELRSARAAAQTKSATVTKLAERAADALIKAGHYPAHRRQDVIDALAQPERALAKIAQMAEKSTAPPVAIGEPVASKEASAAAPLSPFVGGPTTRKKASDEVFAKYFGR